MGTSTTKKKKSKKRNEFKKIKPLSDPELVTIHEQKIIPAIRDLQSPDLVARSLAVSSILKLVTDEKSRKLLLREQIVKVLLDQTVNHSNLETKAESWSILESIAQEEETDFCVHLSRLGILEKLVPILKLTIETIESHDQLDSKPPLAQRDLLWNLTTSIVNLLTLLSESRDEVVEKISKFPIVFSFLFGLLTTNSTPLQVQLEVLSCLIALTEGSKANVERIMDSHNWFETLIAIKESNQAKAINACRILHNIFASMQWHDHSTPIKHMSDAMLIPVLTKHIDDFIHDEIAGQIPSDSDYDLQLAFDTIAVIATALQEAGAHLAQYSNIFIKSEDDVTREDAGIDMETDSILGENDDKIIDADMEIDSILEENDDKEIKADLEMVTGYETDPENKLKVEEVTIYRLAHMATPKIIQIFQKKTSLPEGAKEHALAALNNISWIFSSNCDSITNSGGLSEFWISLVPEIWDQVIRPSLKSHTDDTELISLITSLAWAVARSVKGAIKLFPNEEEIFITLYKASRDIEQSLTKGGTIKMEEDVFDGLGVKCIGILGNLAREPATIDLNRRIGKFLVSVLLLAPEVSLAEVIESLNQIFDIYSDNSFSFDGPVFWGEKLYGSLEEILPKVKKMAKKIDKRKYTELRTRADEAILNLGRFLAYKKKENNDKKC